MAMTATFSTESVSPPDLSAESAGMYADWFATLADSTRVRLLHTVATAPTGSVRVGDLAEQLGVSQSTCSHHVRKLTEVGFLLVDRVGTSSVVSINQACCAGLPHAADVVMGVLHKAPCCPVDLPEDVTVRSAEERHLPAVLDIHAEGIATGSATFEARTPSARALWRQWLPGHAWIAERDGEVVGWAALGPVSERAAYAGVAESTVYVAASARGTGVGKSLLWQQVNEADVAGLWTVQASVFPENRAGIALYHSAGFRTLAVRQRIAQLDGIWRDSVLLERRSEVN